MTDTKLGNSKQLTVEWQRSPDNVRLFLACCLQAVTFTTLSRLEIDYLLSWNELDQ